MSNIDPLIAAITPETKWYVVLRPFGGDNGYRFSRGEVVDVSGWIQPDRLVSNRYITALPHGVDVPEPDQDGVRVLTLSDTQASSVPEKKRPTPNRKRT